MDTTEYDPLHQLLGAEHLRAAAEKRLAEEQRLKQTITDLVSLSSIPSPAIRVETPMSTDPTRPRVFVCHASEEKPLAERVARDLMAAGIDTFYDRWEIRAGDSLRQKIDEGIENCTHFLVLLTPTALLKPWVNAEIDAGYVRRLDKRSRLIPMRAGLALTELPPLLSGLHSPSLDEYESAIQQLISDILGVTDRPVLGPISRIAKAAISPDAGLSIAAGQIAYILVTASKNARSGDPQLPTDELRTLVDLPDDDLIEAVDELEALGWVSPSRALGAGPLGFIRLMPRPQLFAALDQFLMPWNPSEDARTIAGHLVSAPGGQVVVPVLAKQLAWQPRRMNPAITLLVEIGAADHSNGIDQDYQYYSLMKNASTRRFLKSD
jgi:hypothetical protein